MGMEEWVKRRRQSLRMRGEDEECDIGDFAITRDGKRTRTTGGEHVSSDSEIEGLRIKSNGADMGVRWGGGIGGRRAGQR